MSSKEHTALSYRALSWLQSRATGKGIVGTTEVNIEDGYVADAVAIASFQDL